MKSTVSKYFVFSIIALLTSSLYSFADANLPVTKQVRNNIEGEKIEIVPEIKIQAQASSTSSNSNLKEGKACDDNLDNLEEAKGELFVEIPMAKTIPCSNVNCEELKPAKMLKDNYKKLNDADTIGCAK